MKLFLLFVVLFTFATAQNATTPAVEEAEEDDIFKLPPNFGKAIKKGLKDLAKQVGKSVLDKAKDILTDGLQLKPTKQVQNALKYIPSSEGIIEITADILLKKANELAVQAESDGGPSHEDIVANFGAIHKIVEAESLISVGYNKTIISGVSHEGIPEGFGGIFVKGLGRVIGGKVGDVISTSGDIVGNLFFVIPSSISSEDVQEYSEEGIISKAGRVLLKGAGKLAGGLLKAVFGSLVRVLGNVFLTRGNFNGYSNIEAPATEILLVARNKIHVHKHKHVQVCIETAEQNLTQVFNQYVKSGHSCVAAGNKNSKKVLSRVQDIVLNAVRRVEDAHRETGNCFDQVAIEDRVVCLDTDVPAEIEVHRKKILQYGEDLVNYVKQFSDINTQFDECLVGHLGIVRREVYPILDEFHHCVAFQEHNHRHNLRKSV